jgi:5-methylcytosine-specific restriction endonuclease McrA
MATTLLAICKICNQEFYGDAYFIKIGRKKYCSKKCLGKANSKRMQGGVPWLNTPATIAKISKSKKGKPNLSKGKPRYHTRIENNKRSERKQAMTRIEYKLWRHNIFERDDYTCQMCNVKGKAIHADHIIPWSVSKELRYDINNGRTLCIECHEQTDSYPKQFRKVKK